MSRRHNHGLHHHNHMMRSLYRASSSSDNAGRSQYQIDRDRKEQEEKRRKQALHQSLYRDVRKFFEDIYIFEEKIEEVEGHKVLVKIVIINRKTLEKKEVPNEKAALDLLEGSRRII